MGQFKIIKNGNKDITFVVFSGKVLPEDINNALKAFYQSEITSKVVWHFARCDVTAITTESLSFISDNSIEFAKFRTDGKSALVCRDDLPFGLARMFVTMNNIVDHPINGKVFRSTAEALAWLDS